MQNYDLCRIKLALIFFILLQGILLEYFRIDNHMNIRMFLIITLS